MAYNDILDAIPNSEESNITWQFKRIKAHQGPLNKNHPDYNGSSYNVTIEWENGEITDEPLAIIAEDAPIECAKYALKNKLLDKPG